MYGCRADTMFAIRASMRDKPLLFNFAIFFISILIFAQMVRVAESPLLEFDQSQDLHNFENCVWLVVLTMSTVGYGDIYPRTFFGRIILFFCSIFGVLIVSFMVVTVQNELEMSVFETKAYAVIKKIGLKKELKQYAANIIGKSIKIYMKVKKKKPFKSKIIFDLNNEIYNFKNLRR